MTTELGVGLAVLACNGAAFLAQAIDKALARADRRRIRERTLLLLGLPLAAPGMWAGMKLFRHKTRKASFLRKAWLVTAANLVSAALLLWLLTN